MITELYMLAYCAILCILLAFPFTFALIGTVGSILAVNCPQPTHNDLALRVQRAKRAHLNLVENLLVFAVIILIAHVAGISNPTTVLGAQAFF